MCSDLGWARIFSTHMAAPGTARGALVSSVSKLKAELKPLEVKLSGKYVGGLVGG